MQLERISTFRNLFSQLKGVLPSNYSHVTQSKLSLFFSYFVGVRLCMNTGVDSQLVKVVQEHVRKLSSDVATMFFESQEQINNVKEMLTNIQLNFEKRLQQLEHKQAILQHEQGILQREQGILQHEQGILQHEQGILQHEQGIIQHEQDILKKRQNNVEQCITCWKQEAQDNCRSCTYAYLFD